LGWLPNVLSADDTTIAYDMTRAHSADIWFLKLRAWTWGITATVAALCIGNIAGVFGINIFGALIGLISEIIW